MCDFEDQRSTFKATIVSLTERNTALHTELARGKNADTTPPAPQEGSTASTASGGGGVDGASGDNTGADLHGVSADDLQEANIKIQFLESKCARMYKNPPWLFLVTHTRYKQKVLSLQETGVCLNQWPCLLWIQ